MSSLPLRWKILLLGAISGALMLAFVFIVLPWYIIPNMAEEVIEANGRLTIEVLSESLAAGVRMQGTDNGEMLKRTIQAAKKDSEGRLLRSLSVYDGERKLIAGDSANEGVIRQLTGGGGTNVQWDGNRVMIAAPMRSESGTVGWVIGELNTDRLNKRMWGEMTYVGLFGLLVIAFSLAISYALARGLINEMERIANQMNEGAAQVSAASSEVASSSNSLAEGASEQASSIEETSSALEEMASITRQNADHAGMADRMMGDTRKIIRQANDSMGQLTQAMEEITKASEETSKIIKTIDEIAFQTNLLALNAAVEAARAGEAGAGFAVVADEVRNLAMRSADAARNTSVLIEGTIQKIQDGGSLVTASSDAFSEVATSSQKVAELVSEISASSAEQAKGIDHVNKAINEMDKVTQQNAANAQQSASSSEYLDDLARQMKTTVSSLWKLVKGYDMSEDGYYSEGAPTRQRREPSIPTPTHKPAFKRSGGAVPSSRGDEIKADELIPFDDDDFKEF